MDIFYHILFLFIFCSFYVPFGSFWVLLGSLRLSLVLFGSFWIFSVFLPFFSLFCSVLHLLCIATCCASPPALHGHLILPPSSYLISLSHIIFKNMAHVGSFSLFVFVFVFLSGHHSDEISKVLKVTPFVAIS